MNSAIYSPHGCGLYNYIRKVNKIPSLSDKEELSLAKKYSQEKDIKSAHRLVTSHLKLVVKIAMNYRRYSASMLDLISEGNIGLMNAVKKYDYSLGYRLSTYAIWWIKSSIQEFILKSRSLLKIGSKTLRTLLSSNSSLKSQIVGQEKDSDVDPNQNTSSEFDQESIVLSDSLIDDSHNSFLANSNLLPNNASDNFPELINSVPDKKDNQENQLIEQQNYTRNKHLVIDAIKQLSKREQEILHARRLKDKPYTLSQLSEQYSISKERVRQIESNAFEKVKKIALSST